MYKKDLQDRLRYRANNLEKINQELLEACKLALESICDCEDEDGFPAHSETKEGKLVVDKLTKIIAKAEGGK